jgi:putative transcriptional regulator
MAKKAKRNQARPSLADDIRVGLQEALKYARGEKADVIVHRVVPSATDAREARIKLGLSPRHTDAREARHKLGLSQREFASLVGTAVGTVRKWELGTRRPSGAARTLIEVIKSEPKAVRRAIAKRNSAA